MMVNRWQPLGKKRSLIRSAFLFVIYGTHSTHRLRITASNSFKGYRGSLRNGTPSASHWSLKILRGIFLKNGFGLGRRLNKPARRALTGKDSFYLVGTSFFLQRHCITSNVIFLHLPADRLCGLLQMPPRTTHKHMENKTEVMERGRQAWQNPSSLPAVRQGNAAPP